jgi:hypothetical protein
MSFEAITGVSIQVVIPALQNMGFIGYSIMQVGIIDVSEDFVTAK